MPNVKRMSLAGAVIAMGLLSACSGSPAPAPAAPTQPAGSETSPSGSPAAGATESNPPGDIPDNQAYVAFSPPGSGFSVKIPEGWASSTAGATTTFTDKLNRVQVTEAKVDLAPTVASVNAGDLPALKAQVPQFAAGTVSTVIRQAGPAVLVTYQGDSPPNPVTGKVVRDAFERYVFFHSGRRVDLTLSGPTNADNADPWRTVTDSLRWQ